MPYDISKPAGTDAANTIDDSVIANQTAVDTWASAITDGVAQGTGTIIRLRRSANATVVQLRAAAADTTDRFNADLNGLLNWGPGNAAVDVTLARTGTAAATLTGALTVTGAATLTGGTRTRLAQSMVRVTKSATQAITANTDTAVTFDVETFDTDTLHDNVTNNTRLTAAIAGKYLVTGFVEYDAASSTILLTSTWILKNGTTTYGRAGGTIQTNASWWAVSAIVDLAATGYVELMTRYGEARTVQSGTSSTAFSMSYIGE